MDDISIILNHEEDDISVDDSYISESCKELDTSNQVIIYFHTFIFDKTKKKNYFTNRSEKETLARYNYIETKKFTHQSIFIL